MVNISFLKYKKGQVVLIRNESKALDLQCLKGRKLIINDIVKSNNYDYEISILGLKYKVREKEIISLEEVKNMFNIGDRVKFSDFICEIVEVYPFEQIADIKMIGSSKVESVDCHKLKLIRRKSDIEKEEKLNQIATIICKEHDENSYLISKENMYRLIEICINL